MGIDAVGLCDDDGRRDDALFFIAELAVFTGMGIEAADGNTGLLDAEPVVQRLVGQIDGIVDAADGEFIAQIKERLVDGAEDDAEAFVRGE